MDRVAEGGHNTLSAAVRWANNEKADDQACKSLEVSASQFQHLFGLVKAAIVHYRAFDAKACQFPEKEMTGKLTIFQLVLQQQRRVRVRGEIKWCDQRCDSRRYKECTGAW